LIDRISQIQVLLSSPLSQGARHHPDLTNLRNDRDIFIGKFAGWIFSIGLCWGRNVECRYKTLHKKLHLCLWCL